MASFKSNIMQCLFLSISILFIGCGRKSHKPTQLTYIKYVAFHKGDSAIAIINKSKEMFSGSLRIGNGGDNVDSGQVKGVVKGDTLIGEFHYLHYQLEWKRKPVVFLMKKDSLVMGEGLIKLTVGIPHFDPTVPIKFDKKDRLVFKVTKP